MKIIIESYITVSPAAFLDDSPTSHKTEGQAVPGKSALIQTICSYTGQSFEEIWSDNISLSAYFKASKDFYPIPPTISGLMPLIHSLGSCNKLKKSEILWKKFIVF